jgi:hypothetical protein
MKGSIHRSACAVLALVALTLTGCPLKSLFVKIPDFESNLVQGMQLWRADDEASERVTEAGRMLFGDCYFSGNGSEMMKFTMVDSQNQPVENTYPAFVFRGEDGDSALLYFAFQNWSEPSGWFRASSFNVMGESDPSEEAVFL